MKNDQPKSRKARRGGIIKIPHLNTIVVIERASNKDTIIKAGAGAYSQRVCAEEYKIVTPLPIKGPKSAASLVHEIIHVLQYIVEDNTMMFLKEREHLAYLADYIFQEVCKM